MAIASGMPVPPVYLLEHEDGINAFAAGYTPGDAVIGVTRGCIEHLTRDELQGVIAHEFSHILNGDMRLNLRLMGVLYGILLIGLTGWIIFRIDGRCRPVRATRRDDDEAGSIRWPLIGLALYVLGYVGVFFGNLIKAAVSRQREFLADASAVQFTRNPDGIAGALKKIGALAEGSRVRDPDAAGGQPPVLRRRRRPFPAELLRHPSPAGRADPPHRSLVRRATFPGSASAPPADSGPRRPAPATLRPQVRPGRGVFRFNPAEMVNRVGTIEPRQLAYASAVLTSLPDPLKALAYEPFGARAIVLALLVDRDSEALRAAQLERLGPYAEPALVRRGRGDPAARALPRARAAAAPGLDGRPDPEAALARPVRGVRGRRPRADPGGQPGEPVRIRPATAPHSATWPAARRTAPPSGNPSRSAELLVGPVRHVLGVLAHIGSAQPSDAARAFRPGDPGAGLAGVDPSLPPRDLDLRTLDRALDELDAAAPPLKRRILAACAACIGADGQVTLEEGELLRAIADSLGCPVPPLPSLAGVAPDGDDRRLDSPLRSPGDPVFLVHRPGSRRDAQPAPSPAHSSPSRHHPPPSWNIAWNSS